MATNSNIVSDSLALKPLRGLVPMAHVEDVQRSIEFYRQIGLRLATRLRFTAGCSGRGLRVGTHT